MTEATCEEASVCTREGCNHIGEEALGHIYGEATFVWSADYSKATASCICEERMCKENYSDCEIGTVLRNGVGILNVDAVSLYC